MRYVILFIVSVGIQFGLFWNFKTWADSCFDSAVSIHRGCGFDSDYVKDRMKYHGVNYVVCVDDEWKFVRNNQLCKLR